MTASISPASTSISCLLFPERLGYPRPIFAFVRDNRANLDRLLFESVLTTG
jgi:hypothetical protein